jgi:Recombinase/Recombinase zinc beta ribbon domain
MWNGHQESVKKSGRVSEAWAAKRKRLLSRGGLSKPYTRTCPAWLTWDDKAKAFTVLSERAGIVQRIFAKADGGAGVEGIARWLNTNDVPTWGEGGRKAAFWRASYIRKILANKAVVGIFTSHVRRTHDDTGARRDQPLEPIFNYYPPVVDPEVFERVSGRLRTTAARGRNASRSPTSLVAGVAKCARCGSTVLRVSKGKPPKAKYTYLVCSKAHAKAKGCEYQPVRYESVEEALRVNARAIIENAPRGTDTTELEEGIAEQNHVVDALVDDQRFLVEEVIKHKSSAMRRALREKELELRKATDDLAAMRERRDAIASGYVIKRLATLRQALESEPFNIPEANNALKQVVQNISLDPEGSLTIRWHHSEIPTENIPFWSKHSRTFE